MVGSLMAISIAKATQGSQDSLVSVKATNQANMYALSEAELLKSVDYSNLSNQAKVSIPNSNFQKEISVSDESNYSDTAKQKTVTVKIYKENETIPRAELKFNRYSVEQKVVSGVPIGTVITWPSNNNPTDGTWLECNGQSCDAYPALVAILGKSTVPDYRGRFLESDTTAGTIKEAGLPNITGTFSTEALSANGATGNPGPTGSFFLVQGNFSHLATKIEGFNYIIHLDASRSSSIFGNSDTVQPASVTVRRLIKAS